VIPDVAVVPAVVVVEEGAAPAGEAAPSEAQTIPEVVADEIRYTQVPFGPFLALGALFFVLMGDLLWGWIYGFLTPG
jgi:hypothetical protein